MMPQIDRLNYRRRAGAPKPARMNASEYDRQPVQIMRSLRYATHGDAVLMGDLFLPEGDGPHPILLAVPGGAWRYGSRAALAGWGAYLARHGFALFSIDHRRATAGRAYPEAAMDVRAALQFVTANAAAWNCDPDRLGLLGASAGAHLGSLATLGGSLFDSPAFAGVTPSVRALVLVYGVYDLFTHWQACRAENAAAGWDFTERFIGCTPYDDPALYTQASPIRHLRYTTTNQAALVIWGTADNAVAPAQSEAFALALQQARFTVRTCPVVGATHYWFSDDPIDDPHGFTAVVAPRITRFLDRFLSAPAR
jgi:acetyl esterase/lipase